MLRKVTKALRLTPADWLVIAEAWWTLAAVKFRLRIKRTEEIERALAIEGKPGGADRLQRIASLFSTAAGHHVTEMNCLPRAIALQRIAMRRGVQPVLRIGVNRSPSGAMSAHAWLEVDGVPFNEPPDVAQRFTSLQKARDHRAE